MIPTLTTKQWKILRYMRLLAIITPYAQLAFRFFDPENEKANIKIKYARRTDVMPSIPKEVKHHPSSINLVVASDLLRRAKMDSGVVGYWPSYSRLMCTVKTLKKFLRTSFSNITGSKAGGALLGSPACLFADAQIRNRRSLRS